MYLIIKENQHQSQKSQSCKGEEMEYLEKYGVTPEEIQNLKDRYADGIIRFLCENENFVVSKIQYLQTEKIHKIYWLMINNIQIFLESKTALKEKIEGMKQKGMTTKEIQMALLQER